jgi:hypothetical protein
MATPTYEDRDWDTRHFHRKRRKMIKFILLALLVVAVTAAFILFIEYASMHGPNR